MSAFQQVQRSRGKCKLRTQFGREVTVYPNVVTIDSLGGVQISFTPEEWGEIVQFVGITGLAVEPAPPCDVMAHTSRITS